MLRKQSRWMEELAIYNCKFVYVKGEDNTVADTLSRYPAHDASMAKAELNVRHPYQYAEEEELIIIGVLSVGSPVWDGVSSLAEHPGNVH